MVVSHDLNTVFKISYYSELKQSEITSKLGKMWSELDDADKEYWKSQESEENAQVTRKSIEFTFGCLN